MMQSISTSPQFISADHARGGVTGHNVRYVLGAGMTAAVISMIVVALAV